MEVNFTLEFNVETSDYDGYERFIQNLRNNLTASYSHNRPVLARQDRPTRFFDVVLQTNARAVRFRFRSDNLYLIGYQMEDGQWLEFDNWVPDEEEEEEEKKKKKKKRKKKKKLVHLITEPGTNFLGFEGGYRSLASAAGTDDITSINVGFHSLVSAVNELANPETNRNARARSLAVVIMMICESARFIPVFDCMAQSFPHNPHPFISEVGRIPDWVRDLVRSWGNLSGTLLRADAYAEESFQLRENNIRIPPNREVRTIAEAIAIFGILLGLCFYPREQRRSSRKILSIDGDNGQCFPGIPLVQVFSVQINNIDGENPGELYGTITISNGLYTHYIYNRTRDNCESIGPGQYATLTGPSEPVTAFGSFTIELLLTDKDIISSDDVIINQVISWDSASIGNVYDELIPETLDSSLGSVTVNYAVLRNAAAARVTVTLKEGGEDTTEVYGKVSARYYNWVDPENTTCLLFERTDENYVEVSRGQNIPLLRSVIAVPMNESLLVTANLKDYDPTIFDKDDLIANGTVEFPVPDTIPASSSKDIYGEDGNWVKVIVEWSSGL